MALSRMDQTLVLFGSGEFTPKMAMVDRHLIQLTGKIKPTVAILPLAAGRETAFDRWLQTGHDHFASLNTIPLKINIRDRTDADQTALIEPLIHADLIYFSGGDPGYLLSSVSGTKLWKVIRDRYSAGSILVGSSAGAMVFGRYVLTNPYQITQQGEQPHWRTGLSLLPATVIPHFDFFTQKEPREYSFILDHTSHKIVNTLIGVDENTALIITPVSNSIMGDGSVHSIPTHHTYSATTKPFLGSFTPSPPSPQRSKKSFPLSTPLPLNLL